MSTVGIGDILGRISAGFLSSYKCIDSVLAYAVAMILCGIAIAFHICATWGPMFPLLTGLFGFFYGQQNVFITIVPAVLFGRENLVSVFGYILFFAGLGALVGTPLAGYIVDRTGSYMGVVSLSFSCCVIGGLCTIVCCIIHRRKQKISQRTISV
ncbi:Monocarboxylate transporter 9 [Armadillidium nasatum]|uniref:Monocarboxylate transporter 9 n=1 Tax=Armadillidium nasatum TaxID=96803 RepID=A0A5N5TAM6_9CRUS|nr:Monocarboxylate transporter 9 [Armadillidium nasatum]